MSNPFRAIADAMVAQAHSDMARHRQRDALREIGIEAIDIGLDALRRKPNASIDAADWGVFKVRWTGREWKRVKRFAARCTLSEAYDRAREWETKLGLQRRDSVR